MKVIEPPNKEKVEVIEFNQANNECRYCPCCGTDFYGTDNIDRMEYTITDKHTFYTQTYKVMRYDCYGCGCKYESEPYNYEAFSIMSNEDSNVYISVFSSLGAVISFMIGLLGSIIARSIIPLIIGGSLLILIGVYVYLCFNYYKKYNKNKFKPYKVYKNIGDK